MLKQRLIFEIHAYGSINERALCRMQISPQHNSLKIRKTPKLATAFRYVICKHSALLRRKVIRALPNRTVM